MHYILILKYIMVVFAFLKIQYLLIDCFLYFLNYSTITMWIMTITKNSNALR